MIKEVKLNTVADVLELMLEQQFDDSIQRYRSSYLYRGVPNSSYHLVTSLKRNCKHKQFELENCILRNFAKYAENEDPRISESVWRKLIIGQHHGLPTRMLDWTYSPLVGLHFATSGEDMSNMEKHDGVVWRINIEEQNALLPKEYQQVLNDERAYLFTIDMIERVAKSLEEYDSDMNGNSFILMEPPSIDQRIISQYSYFSIIPKGMDDIEQFLDHNTVDTVKYVIDKSIRWNVRDMLDQMNLNERTVYPGLDGLSAWLKRHYYVR